MISTWLIVLFAFIYLCLLFYIGYQGDKRNPEQISVRNKAIIYSLSLGVYCTSWTFYGAVGTASTTGIGYLPIYLGPILLFVFGWPILRRIAVLSFEQKTTSIADFIASRYGKSRSLAVLVTTIAILAVVPYLALQLKAITMGFDVLVSSPNSGAKTSNSSFFITLFLIIFSILFGTRKLDITEHQHGLMNAIAFESIVKLCAFIAVGFFAIVVLSGESVNFNVLEQAENLFLSDGIPNGFFTQCLLAMAAIICLPRQFHVSFVEYHHPKDLEMARWVFPLYLSLFCIFVVPIAIAGSQYFSGLNTNADTFVIALPLFSGQNWLALLALIGGFSAATGMVIVASITLSTMISNDIVMPILMRFKNKDKLSHADFSFQVLSIRRIVIAILIFTAYIFYRALDHSQSLANIGLLAFSVVAHFAPAILLGIYWRRANQVGAFLGMSIGVIVWILLAGIPGIKGANLLAVQDYTYFGFSLLTESTFISLSLNLSVFIFCSFTVKSSMSERIQSFAFTHKISSIGNQIRSTLHPSIKITDLQSIATSVLGEQRAADGFNRWFDAQEKSYNQHDTAPAELIRDTELMLSGVIGAPSARGLIVSALKDKGLDLDDVVSLIASTSDAVRFNRNLLESVMNNINQGISVVDAENRIVGWNQSYLDIMKYPEDLITVGKPLDEIIRFNAERGFCGPGDVDEHVEKRMSKLRNGLNHRFERFREDGVILEIIGNPLPGGGYVTTYTDISEYKKIESALRENEANIRVYTDNSPTQLAYIDKQNQITFCNNAFAEQFSLTKEELVGKNFSDLIYTSEIDELNVYLDAAFAGTKQQFEIETKNHKYLLGTIIPDHKPLGVAGLYIVFHDISSRRQAELALQEINTTLEERVTERTLTLSDAVAQLKEAKQEAEHANISKTRFLAAASHDLLQPFNAAKLFAAVLDSSKDAMPEKQADIVKKMSSSLQSAENILRALIEMSKLDSTNLVPNISSFPIQHVLDSAYSQFSGIAENKEINLLINPSEIIVRCDRQLLQRVLQNLISNALRYTEIGTVSVVCEIVNRHLRINIIDTGIGIAEKDIDGIFEEFKQLKTHALRPEDQGIGLGLAISQRIALLLGSDIKVESTLGEGSCFSIEIELSAANTQKPVENNTKKQVKKSNFQNKLSILCLDNEPQILTAMQVLLEDWNCVVKTASNRQEFKIIIAEGYQADIVFADYHLDHDDTGIEVLDSCRDTLAAEFVIISADHSSDLQAIVEDRGYQLLLKPVDAEDLKRIIENTKS